MDAQRVRLQLDRILESTAFADADRASRFLRFVVEHKLGGHAGEIKESVIAVEVLGRSQIAESSPSTYGVISKTTPAISPGVPPPFKVVP